jgi:biopolymer transport protein ExbB
MKKILSIVLLAVVLTGAKETPQALIDQETALLREQLSLVQDSLEEEIAARWQLKKQHAKNRELDKQRYDETQQSLQRLYADRGRLKEQNLVRETALQTQREELATTRQEWQYIRDRLGDVLSKESERVVEAFPFEQESHRLAIERLRNQLATGGRVTEVVDGLVAYYRQRFREGSEPRLQQEMMLTTSGTMQQLNVARLGNVAAYAQATNGTPYIIRQTGKLGAERFSLDTIGSAQLSSFVTSSFPLWGQKGRPFGTMTLDVLQNAQAQLLISGQKVTMWENVKEYFRQGGVLMAPLVLIMLWAMILVIYKWIQLTAKNSNNRQLYAVVKKHLSEGKIDDAYTFASTHSGVVTKIVRVCLEHSKWSKKSAEKAIREILVEETPELDKNLSTLAVLAGVAPLLGLLGTVTGMIEVFNVITQYGTGDPKLLAGGISEALVTTEVGLVVAIPILLAHNYLSNRSENIQGDMQKHAVRILNRLWPQD